MARKAASPTVNTPVTLMTMNTNPLHFDAAYAAKAQHGRCQRLLVMATVGMSVKDERERDRKPGIRIVIHSAPLGGDTLYPETTVLRPRLRKETDRGIICGDPRLVQNGEEVMILRRKILGPAAPVKNFGPLPLDRERLGEGPYSSQTVTYGWCADRAGIVDSRIFEGVGG